MQPREPASSYRDPPPFTAEAGGHAFTFYPAGADRLAALLETIGDAQNSLQIFYYMFADDEDGSTVRDALVAAARRGVAIDLLVDGFGTASDACFFAPIVQAGGRFSTFSPRWNVRYLIRNHQKFVIADGEVVLCGGANVSQHYFAPPQDNGWCDLSLKVSGPVVQDFIRWFGQLAGWIENPKAQFRSIRKLLREWDPGEGPVQLLLGGPTRVPSSWSRRIKADLITASRLDLVMAYFSPPRSFRRAMRRIAGRGRVRMVLPAKSDNTTTIGAARLLYGKFIKSGATICEFQPCKLHMKLVVVDDATYVGSANFDMRSLRLNLEDMLRIEDAQFAARMRGFIDHLADASQEVELAAWRRQRGLFTRLRWMLGWALVSVIDYSVTRRLNLGIESGADSD